MAVAMTFVIVNKELDLSVGSILGLVATVFSILYAPSHLDLGVGWAVFGAVLMGTLAGFCNGFLVTRLKVPAFIATLTMLFIGRGLVLGLTGGKTIAYERKAAADPWFFGIGETNVLGFNNQIIIFLVVAAFGALSWPRRGRATRPTPWVETSRPPPMPASPRAGSACAPTSSPPSPRPWPA